MQLLESADVEAFVRAAGLELNEHQALALRDLLSVDPDTGTWRTAQFHVRQPSADLNLVLARALFALLVLGDNVLWSVQEGRSTRAAHHRLRAALLELGTPVEGNPNRLDVDGVPIKIRNANGDEGAERLDTGARIRFVCRRYAGSSRGYLADLVVVDDAHRYTAAQHEELLPTTASRPNPQIVYV